MKKTQTSGFAELLRAWAERIARQWPEESAPWGRAMAAEVGETGSAAESARWLIGGVMFFLRETVRQFVRSLGRPVGVPAKGPVADWARGSRRIPRMPRAVTALLLAASAAILLLPEVRGAITAVMESYSRNGWDEGRWASVKKLEAEEAKRHDPQLEAVLVMLSGDPKQREELADHAIAQDASLGWLDYEVMARDPNRTGSEERLERLERWDPDNAAVRFLRAHSLFSGLWEAGRDYGGSNNGRVLTPFEAKAEANPAWMAAMDRAFTAPRYDNYFDRRFAQLQAVTQRYGVEDSRLVERAVETQPIPSLSEFNTYEDIVIHRAAEHERQGDADGALADGRELVLFGSRMDSGEQSVLEHSIAANLGQRAAAQLAPLLERTGHAEEAALVDLKAATWKRWQEERSYAWRSGIAQRLEWSGLTMQSSLLGAAAFGTAGMFALLFVWLRRDVAVEQRSHLHGFACAVADAAPLLMLGCAAALYLTWHPFAETIRSSLAAQGAPASPGAVEDLLWATRAPEMIPVGVQKLMVVESGQVTFPGWIGITAALCMLACFFLYRLTSRREEAIE